MAQAIHQSISTLASVEGAEPIAPEIAAMLAPFFNGRRGDAPELALPTPVKNRPAPSAERELAYA